jgi:putative transposase
MIHYVLRPQYPDINHKRVYRLYAQEGLAIRKRKKPKRVGVHVPLVQTQRINQTWSMDFVSDSIVMPIGIARRIKCLTVADDFSHECVDIAVYYGIGGKHDCGTRQHCFEATHRRCEPTMGRNSPVEHS